MDIRTTTLGTTNAMLGYISSAQSRYYELLEESSSGKKVTEPSDDPSATKGILNTNTKLSQLDQYLQNMSVAQTELDTLDTNLSSLTDLIEQANDLATQTANGTYSSEDMTNTKTQVDGILDSVLDIANTEYNGKYLFSGTATKTQTYTEDANGNITYNGTDTSTDAYKRYVTISDGVNVSINAAGDDVFGSYTTADTTKTAAEVASEGLVEGTTTTTSGNTTTIVTNKLNDDGTMDVTTETATGLVGTLKLLSNALEAGDHDAVNATLSGFNSSLDTVLATQTKFASVSSRFEMTESSINTTVTNLKSYRSELQDADLAEVATQLAAQETALQATYSITSSMLSGASLLDYM